MRSINIDTDFVLCVVNINIQSPMNVLYTSKCRRSVIKQMFSIRIFTQLRKIMLNDSPVLTVYVPSGWKMGKYFPWMDSICSKRMEILNLHY